MNTIVSSDRFVKFHQISSEHTLLSAAYVPEELQGKEEEEDVEEVVVVAAAAAAAQQQ